MAPAPFPTVVTARSSSLLDTGADPEHDVLLIRAGLYPESMTIGQPVTLRATRGAAVIGR